MPAWAGNTAARAVALLRAATWRDSPFPPVPLRAPADDRRTLPQASEPRQLQRPEEAHLVLERDPELLADAPASLRHQRECVG